MCSILSQIKQPKKLILRSAMTNRSIEVTKRISKCRVLAFGLHAIILGRITPHPRLFVRLCCRPAQLENLGKGSEECQEKTKKRDEE